MKLQLVRKYTEAGEIVSFRFHPEKPLIWQAGQYLRYTLHVSGEPIDHWFTIASAPYEKETMITTRVHADSPFKQTLNMLEPGDTVDATGLDGDFVWRDSDKPLIFVAGGIGITPFHSMITERAHSSPTIPVDLLYANRDDNIAYKSQFDDLSRAHPEFRVSYLIGKKIDADVLNKHFPDLTTSLVYVSGPEPMVDAMSALLHDMGVEDHNLMRDDFPGYKADE